MKGELTAIIKKAPEGGYWAICPKVPGAKGQGETVEEAKENLREAVSLILDDRLEDVAVDRFQDHLAFLDNVKQFAIRFKPCLFPFLQFPTDFGRDRRSRRLTK